MPSSVIKTFDYLPEEKILAIVYQSGSVYHYKGVPEKLFKEMKASISKGRYFNFRIRNKFPFERIFPAE